MSAQTPQTVAATALAQAQTPDSVAVASYRPDALAHVDSAPSGPELKQFLKHLMRANTLRHQGQEQVAKAVAAMAGSTHLNWARLAAPTPGTAPRKPRVELWAEVNSRGTLQVFWAPVVDSGTNALTASTREQRTRSDFVKVAPTWSAFGVHPQVVFRVLEDQYLASVPPGYSEAAVASGKRFMRDALADSLTSLVSTLGAVCDVTIGDWPVYLEDGQLVLQSARERAAAILRAKLPGHEAKRQQLGALMAEKLTKLGLASLAEFEAVQLQAREQSAKVSSLIFAKTGKRCSSLTVAGLEGYQVEAAGTADELQRIASALEELTAIKHWAAAA